MLSHPSLWWNNFFRGKLRKYLACTQKSTNDTLWIDGVWDPWVRAKFATTAHHLQFDGQMKLQSGSKGHGALGREYNRDVHKLSEEGRLSEALQIMDSMVQQGIRASIKTFACILQSCIRSKALAEGKQVHAHIVQSKLESNVFLGNTLINMYAKCGSMLDARQVFQTLPEHDLFSWTAIISAYTNQGQCEEAINLFQQMQQLGTTPDKVVFAIILKACANLAALEQGKQVHAHIIKSGCELDIFVGSTLIDMYAKCGSIEDARQVFNKMHERNVVSWTVMIAGYVQEGNGEEAFTLFEQMQQEGVKPNNVTFISILKACASLAALEQGKQLHSNIIKSGFESDVLVGNTLVGMYAKCGSLEDACQVFNAIRERDVVSWNAIIAGYAQQGHGEEALTLFHQMQCEGVKPDSVTFVNVLKACIILTDLERGKQVHGHVIRSGFESDLFVGNTLVDMYAKCGSIEEARQVFNRIHKRDVVSWTAMIAGYAQQGHGEEALTLFEEMQEAGVKPNTVTFANILKVCGSLMDLERGKQIHAHVIESGIDSNVLVGNTLVGMYARCGRIEDAFKVFNKMHKRDVASWNAMIAAYAQQGYGEEALKLFKQMQQEGMKPDEITFLCVLSACSHAGLVDEGRHHFYSMSQDHNMTPTMDHYACMVDLLARAGNLDLADDFINKMPIQPNAIVWMALLGACRNRGNVKLGRCAFECLSKLEPKCAGAYVLLSNIYAVAGRWDEVAKIRKEMEDAGVKKEPGCSWIEINNEVHAFFVADRTHPESKEIQAEVKLLTVVMKDAGYVPDLSSVLLDIPNEKKEDTLCCHSEKLAIGFGLITTAPGTPIHIKKNLRVCGDCHNAFKMITKIVGREIIARDASRFHHFKDGVCSCANYW